jgi:lipoprotein-anchoring transpeptidase ErfK/SrfK
VAKKINLHLIKIFYFPLVILSFVIVFACVFSLFTDTSYHGEEVSGNGNYDSTKQVAYFNDRPVEAPGNPFEFAKNLAYTKVLAESSGEKVIDVNLSTQSLTAYEPDGSIFMQVPISSGLWGKTPTGTYRIWIKLRYTLMKGGSKEKGTYYYLPNVPCTQYFYQGYGLHGAYWHNNFGQPMSHGCINMRVPDSCQLFEWTSPHINSDQNTVKPTSDSPGTKVVIHN